MPTTAPPPKLHVHYWLIEASNGSPQKLWRGHCKHCEMTRTWPIEPDYRAHESGEGMQVWRGRQEMDELLAEATA